MKRSAFLVLSILLLLGGVVPAQAAELTPQQKSKIEPQLLTELNRSPQTDFFIWLDNADLSAADNLTTKAERGQYVFDTLRQHADTSQQSLRQLLDSQGANYQSYYIVNRILVRGGDASLLNTLAARADVIKLTANHAIQLPEPFRNQQKEALDSLAVESNLTFVHADDVWALGVTGEGVVLAGNDTGIQWDHPALKDHYRGWDGVSADHNYNWWDATGTYANAPGDGFGHGTHTTGTMIGDDGGDNQIGIAPGSRTIHCKNLDDFGGGGDDTILTCFQWDLAPWDLSGNNPRPDLAPDAINNSWGYGGGGYPAFADAINALQSAGIFVELSAGNEGPSCQTLRSPGDYSNVMTTGSVNHSGGVLPGDLTPFSSRGASTLEPDAFIPDIMAPGENIRSALPGNNYEAWSGTSMAGPHVTGLIGLLWSANPGLRGFIPETQQIIAQTAVPLSGQTGSNCGGDYDTGPNNDWGFGTINALAATEAAITFGEPGTLQGTVTDSNTTQPIVGAQVRAMSPGGLTWKRTTDTNGFYSTLIFSGTYTVTAQIYGYFPDTVTDVAILTDQTTTVDMALDPAPFYTVSGVVSDGTAGYPLYAKIIINGYPGDPIWTDPVTGAYNISLSAGVDYTFQVVPWVNGYQGTSVFVPALTSNTTLDFPLTPDLVACTAPGYQPDLVYYETFESDNGGFTIDGNSSWAYGNPTSGPNAAHSGDNVWATNLAGNYNNGEFSTITSPPIDLSGNAGQTVVLSWWQWAQTEPGFDYIFAEVSNDGGNNWATYYGWESGDISLNWQKQTIFLDPSYAVADFQVRFGFTSDGSVVLPGFYVDDVGVGVATTPPNFYFSDFEADNGNLTVAGTNASWAWGIPTRGPSAARSGSNAWATNLDDNYNANENSQLESADIDLSGASGDIVFTWWQWLQTELNYDYASVDVSNDGGATWTTMFGPASGIYNGDDSWYQYNVYLDNSYAVSDFRFRFTLTSDNSVAYPGFYVDDVTILNAADVNPAVPCLLEAGSLLVGQVLDENTSAGINQATIRHETENTSVRSLPTPTDPAVGDGFYTLFSPAGTHTITASKAQYGSDSASVVVPTGTTLLQNFSLNAGILSANPTALSATLDMGDATTLSFDLQNIGGNPVHFNLRERLRPFVPARAGTGAPLQQATGQFTPASRPASAPTYPHSPAPLLTSAPPWQDVQPFPIAIQDNTAAAFEGKIYSVGGVDSSFQFLNHLYIYDTAANTWTTGANMGQRRQKPSAVFSRGLLYVVGGWDEFGQSIATLEIYDPSTDSWTTGANIPVPVAGAPAVNVSGQIYVIGGCTDGSCATTNNVYRYDPESDSWDNASAYPQSISWQSCGVLEGMIYCAGGVEGFNESNRTYVYDPNSDTWTRLADMLNTQWGSAFVAANGVLAVAGGVTNNFSTITNITTIYDPATDTWTADANTNEPAYRGASACGFYKIGGFSGTTFDLTSRVEQYPDLNECTTDVDISWLEFSPVEGDVTTGGSQTVQVSLDASTPDITQPGTYNAEIRVSDDSPYQMANVPVAMTVNPPATWGKVTGTVSGFARCAGVPNPLHRATVTVTGVTEIKTETDGSFGYWLPAGNYSITYSHPDYVAKTQNVTIGNGQTVVRNIGLHLNAPCGAAMPNSFDLTVPVGSRTNHSLFLDNLGAGAMAFRVLETSFQLPIIEPVVLPLASESPYLYTLSAPVGAMSVQSVDPNGNAGSNSRSNWYAGSDLPGGLLRYGHAQCAEQPNSFYVMSGVDSTARLSTGAWRYDALDNAWQPLAAMPTSAEGPAATCYQGRIYVMGGSGTNQFFIYDIASDKWMAGAPLPRSVWGAAAGSWGGKVYLIGGDSDFNPGGTSSAVNIYDIASDTWLSDGADMPVPTSAMGFAQLADQLYVVGGWGDDAPTANVNATQRYDMAADSWLTGATFSSARADFALTATSQNLYAIGGDSDGQNFFDPTTTVEQLPLATWDSGAWSDTGEPLPSAITSNNAGFCTAGNFFAAQVYSVGGLTGNFSITGVNRFLGRPNETCYSIYSDVPWLAVAAAAGTVTPNGEETLTMQVNAHALLLDNTYEATLVVVTNDAGNPQIQIPVSVTVEQAVLYLPVIRR